MSKKQSTPGPWEVLQEERRPDGSMAHIIARVNPTAKGGAGYFRIGEWIDYEWDSGAPNARLIAAAPDMYAACRMALSVICQAQREFGFKTPLSIQELEDVIAYAEGRGGPAGLPY